MTAMDPFTTLEETNMTRRIDRQLASARAAFMELTFPKLDDRACPEDFEAVAKFLRDLIAIVDPLIEEAGETIHSASAQLIDTSEYREALSLSLEGVLWGLECAATDERNHREVA